MYNNKWAKNWYVCAHIKQKFFWMHCTVVCGFFPFSKPLNVAQSDREKIEIEKKNVVLKDGVDFGISYRYTLGWFILANIYAHHNNEKKIRSRIGIGRNCIIIFVCFFRVMELAFCHIIFLIRYWSHTETSNLNETYFFFISCVLIFFSSVFIIFLVLLLRKPHDDEKKHGLS